MRRVDSWGKTRMLGKIEGGRRRGRQRMRCLDGITNLMDMSLSNSGSWWWTGKPGVLQSMGSQRVRCDWVIELNLICLVPKSCLTLCTPMHCSPPGYSVHGTSQARILECFAMPSSRGSLPPRDRTHVLWVSCENHKKALPHGLPSLLLCPDRHTVFPVWPDMMCHVLSTWKPWVINSSFTGSCLWVCHLTILIKTTPGSLFKTFLDSQTVRTLSLRDMAKEQWFSKCALWISSITLLEMHQLVRDANSQSPFRLPASETLGRGSRLFWYTLQLEKPYSLEAHGNPVWEYSC